MAKISIFFLLLFFLLFPQFHHASQDQVAEREVSNLSVLCKTWGFLKYFHPWVVAGEQDWDEVLLSAIPAFRNAEDKSVLQEKVSELFQKAGNINYLDYPNTMPTDPVNDPSFQWIEDETVFDWYTILLFKIMKINRVPGYQYYVQTNINIGNTAYGNEKEYSAPDFPDENHRLLSLFRFWNIIHHYFPYKDDIGRDWEEVLDEYIPKVKNTQNALEYHLIMRKFTAEINDSHAFFRSNVFDDFLGKFYPPFQVRYIEGRTIVTEVFQRLLENSNDIQKGDIILECDGVDISTLRENINQYMAASNEAVLNRNSSAVMFRGNKEFFNLVLLRNGKHRSIELKRYAYDLITSEIDYQNGLKNKHEMLPGNICYVNMGLVYPGDVLYITSSDDFKNSKGVIFDIRNYPNGTLYFFANILNPAAVDFVKFTKPDLEYPGTFSTTSSLKAGLAGGNDKYYKGKVVILADEETQSHAEFTCMALQTAPEAMTIGSQTAGADGNVSYVFLPGGIRTYFTGIGVYYPDGTPTQRVGIKIDKTVRPTLSGIRDGRDEVLEAAIEYLNNN